jgi:Cu/Ag efflux protein CusF
VISKRLTPALLAGAIALVIAAVGAGVSSAGTVKSVPGLHSFHGKVSAVSTKHKALRIKRTGGSSVRFTVTSSTTYGHVTGLSGLHRGDAVEVKARKVNGAWVARKIEGAENEAGDDRGGHGNEPGDDHGTDG